MGLRESSKVTKRVCLLPPIRDWATCLLTEPGLDLCPQHPQPWACACALCSQLHNPKMGSFPRADGASSKRHQHGLMIKHCHWTPGPALEAH